MYRSIVRGWVIGVLLLASIVQPASASDGVGSPIFNVENVYLKSMATNTPAGPMGFLLKEPTRVEQDELKIGTNALGSDYYEVVLTAKVRVFRGRELVFTVEANQAGIFLIKGVGKDELQQLLRVSCASILFPFLREAVASAPPRSGQAPVIFSPVNFEAMHKKSLGADTPTKYQRLQ